MRKPVIVIFILLLLEAVSGCTSPVRRQLDRAEAVMESAPDSALAILDSIDTATLTRASDRALYALLLTQGRIKAYEVLTDDSLISTAVSHYEDHGSDSNLMKSLFYQGEIRHNIQDYPSAIIPAMRAREIAVNANDIYWQAKAAELLSFILQSSYNYEEAIKYSKEAVKYYNLIHKEINHRYSLCDLGINYYNTQDYVKSKQILDSLYGLTLEADSFLHAYVLSALYPVYFYSGDKGRAFEFMDELKQYRKHYNWNIKDYARFVQLEIGFKDFSSYNDFVASIDPANLDNPEKAIYYQTKEKYYDEIGDFRRSAMMKDSVKQISDREIENILRQPVLASQRNFYKDRVLLEREHNDKLQKQIIIIAVVSVIVVLVLILIWQIRSRIKNIEIERRIGDIMDLSKELTRYSLKYDAIKTRLSEREHDILDLNDKIEDQFKRVFHNNC